MDEKEEMRVLFYEKLNEILAKKANNSHIFSKEKYDELVLKVKVAQSKTSHKLPKEYHMLKIYNVVNIDGVERLTYSPSFFGGTNKIYVYTDEVFDILYETHLKVNHGGREKMLTEVQKGYKNVTQELVTLYLSLCQTCKNKNRRVFINQAKRSISQSKSNSKPKIIENLTKYQIEIIDMSKEADNGQKYILVYRNMGSDYIQLRTLRNDDISDLVPALLDIFTIFGVPCILFSTLGSTFLSNLIVGLQEEWPEIKIISGDFPNLSISETERQVFFDHVKARLNDWKKANRTCNWTKGVRFVQLLKNRSHSKTSRTLPHDWIFRNRFSEGLKSLISENELHNINTEKDIQDFVNFEKDGMEKEDNLNESSLDDASSEKIQKVNESSNTLVDFCHSLFTNDLLTPMASEELVFVKEEPRD